MAKILAIDNELGVLDTLRTILVERGHEVIYALSGEEGITKFKKENPDIVICDIKMPGKDGYEVLKEIKKDPTKWRPVIMLTVLNEMTSIRKAYDYEVDYYITKPFKVEDIIKAIHTMIALKDSRIKTKT
ncbi:MAG: response regulator [Candidatus Omnitrophica bacterium]|nr:response regulator [Candidatus Omnitrophota bacterium]